MRAPESDFLAQVTQGTLAGEHPLAALLGLEVGTEVFREDVTVSVHTEKVFKQWDADCLFFPLTLTCLNSI